ncbi:hypothetical protein JB92DRAFT_2980760 [Gautieria morchelliformis]|nr:hypothetical protein JB92DRAFT_2980760 [Gautieria morchelliformis]
MPLTRCYSTLPFAITRFPARTTAYIHLAPKRSLSNKSQPSPVRYEPDPDASPENVQNEFIQHTTFAFKNLGKMLAYVGYGTLIVGLVTATAYEGGHLWIERKMHITPDEDAKRWGWEVEGWTGGDGGGTSPALGFVGRHAVRAAWFSLYYDSPFGGVTTISQANGANGMGNLNVAPSDLESARIYLEEAMARVRDQHGRVRMDTVGSDLLERHAAVLERIGTRAALARAREEYLQIFDDGRDARFSKARFAVKIGDISERLGNVEAALTWWTRGITLATDDNFLEISTPTRVTPPSPSPTGGIFTSALWKWTMSPPEEASSSPLIETKSSKVALPNRPPSSPAAQRTLVAALLSISAHYSKINQLKEAKLIQEYAISLIDAMAPMPMASSYVSRAVQSAGQSLHHMYLLQRKSVFALHHAEVTYSLAPSSVLWKARPLTEPVMDLLTAASSSEIVAQVLTGTSSLPSDAPYGGSSQPATERPKVPHPAASHAPLASAYGESLWLRPSARSVLRDARRTAVEAWDLCGVLYKEIDRGELKAVECFERALGWAEEPRSEGERLGATTVDAWQFLWERYMEARGTVRAE